MGEEKTTVYIFNNNDINKTFEFIGKVAAGTVVGYGAFCGIKRVAQSEKVRSLFHSLSSRK